MNGDTGYSNRRLSLYVTDVYALESQRFPTRLDPDENGEK